MMGVLIHVIVRDHAVGRAAIVRSGGGKRGRRKITLNTARIIWRREFNVRKKKVVKEEHERRTRKSAEEKHIIIQKLFNFGA